VRYMAGRFALRIRIAIAAGVVLSGAIAAPIIGTIASPASAAPVSTVVKKEPVGKSILLINGDRLVVAGKSTAVQLAGSGFSAAVTKLRLAGREYAVPDVALPFLGRGLDLSLFDIAAQPGGATLPLRITYTGKVPRLPGVTISRATGGVATGYLTAAGAKTFGAALARQFAADHGAASYGADGLFAGGLWIAATGVTAPAMAATKAGQVAKTPAAPRFPMHTVTVRGVTAVGKPDTGDLVFLYNATNNGIYGDPYEDPSVFYHGTAKFSVPAGQYWALAWITMVDKKGNPTGLRVVMEPRVTIKGNATITMRARSATSKLAFTTPKPATLTASVVQFVVTDLHHDISGFGFFSGPGFPIWFSPTTRRLAAGTFSEFVNVWLTAPASGPAAPDTGPDLYSGVFQDTSGLIKPQHFTLRAASLATVHAVYSSGAATTGGVGLSGFTTAELLSAGTFTLLTGVAVPALVTEHLLTGSGTYWQNAYYQSLSAFGGGQSDVVRSLAPGSDTTQDWNVYPLHTPLDSNVPVSLPSSVSPFYSVPLSATRVGNDLSLNVNPFTDDTTGHTGTGFGQGLINSIGAISGSYEIDDNGKSLGSGGVPSGFLSGGFNDVVALPAAPSTVAFTLRAKRTGALFPLSTAVTDTWTWRSASGPSITVPAGWYCADYSTKCAVQPLLNFGYQVAHIAVDGTTPGGAQQVRIGVRHQALVTSPPAVTGLTAQYSLNGGTTWQQATVTGSGGTWYASYDAPSRSYVSLRVTATDAAGGALTETITRAYATQSEVAAAVHRAPAVPVLDAVVSPAGPTANRAAAPTVNQAVNPATPTAGAASGYRSACAPVGPGQARCFVLFAPEPTASASTAGVTPGMAAKPTTPDGWGARAIEHAYKLPIGRDSHATVAVVEAYDTPRLETYLNVYRKQYGLKPCTVGNGCFRKVGQSGSAKHLPASGVDSGWDLEATLDVDMVSAACPTCRILVVEANGQDFGQLAAAENTAVRLGAVVVSNSYGARETGQDQQYAKAYDHPGRTIVVSAGDYGYTAASFPANQQSVTAVGGTELFQAKNKRGWRETAWNEPFVGAGSSGCSAYIAKPGWQHDKHCTGRTIADVSAVAWNLAIYNKDWGGWGMVGGTSASSPIVAGIYGLAGNATKIKPGAEYAHAKALFDVTTGNNDWFFAENGAACGNDYLCVAKKGYDAPTGLGTPDGIGAF
jgi:hypothetical protein